MVEMEAGGFISLLVFPLTLTSAGRGAAAVPLLLLIWCVAASRSGILLPSQPGKVVS